MKSGLSIVFSLIILGSTNLIAKEPSPTCAELSDQFCEKLWSPEHLGNLEENGYAFYLGDSKKSELSVVAIKYYQSFINAAKSFPSDLKENILSSVQKLEDLLKNEKPGNGWTWDFAEMTDHIGTIIRKTSDERVYVNHPELKDKKWDDYTLMDRMPLRESQYDLKNQIMDLQFKNDPNWKRIERVFLEVKRDLLEYIGKFPPEVQEYAYEKIKSIRLSLPYEDLRTIGAKEICEITNVNAFYYDPLNALTVCAGLFTSIQDDAYNYHTLTHEMAHAIDPNNYNKNAFMNTKTGRLLQKFYGAKGPAESCEEWALDKEKILNDTGFSMGISPYDHLTSCLRPRNKLEAFDEERVKKATERKLKSIMAAYADYNSFTLLAQPTVQKYGQTRSNEYYMRPDRLIAKYNEDLYTIEARRDSAPFELFTQIFACRPSTQSTTQRFSEALKEHRQIQLAIKNKLFAYCGRECADLEPDNLALNSGELFADWVANKLFSKRVLREQTLEAKRSFVARSEPMSCQKPGPLKEAPHLTKIEKTYSLEPHPEARVRRLAVFQPEIVEIIQCQATDEIPTGEQNCGFE